MARAKRTARSDARRRYRQVHDHPELAVEEAGAESSAPAPMGKTRVNTSQPARPVGFMDSMRASWHRPDVRADIAALPSLLLTRAFLIPLALVVLGVALIAAVPSSPVASLSYQLFVLPPAMAPIFIAGFFAKRASYLLGLIIALVDLIGYVFLVYSASAAAGDLADRQKLILSMVAIGPLSGIFFAAGAAWYRRFLSFSTAQRSRGRTPQRTKGGRSGRS